MSEIKLQRENTPRNVSVRQDNEIIDNIFVGNTSRQQNNNFNPLEMDLDNGGSDEDNMGLDFFTNKEKLIDVGDNQEENGDDYDEESEGGEGDYNGRSDPFMNREYTEDTYNGMSVEEIMHKKGYLLAILKRYEKKGIHLTRRFTTEHSIDELNGEIIRIKKEKDLENGVSLCKQGLVFLSNAIEIGNKRFYPFAKLKGLSSAALKSQDDYDDVFEELYEKYASEGIMSPEVKFIALFGGMIAMTHIKNSKAEEIEIEGNYRARSRTPPRRRSRRQEHTEQPKQSNYKMKGPSDSAEDLLNELQYDSDNSNDSLGSMVSNSTVKSNRSNASEVSEISVVSEKDQEKNIVVKRKRGRPPKNPK